MERTGQCVIHCHTYTAKAKIWMAMPTGLSDLRLLLLLATCLASCPRHLSGTGGQKGGLPSHNQTSRHVTRRTEAGTRRRRSILGRRHCRTPRTGLDGQKYGGAVNGTPALTSPSRAGHSSCPVLVGREWHRQSIIISHKAASVLSVPSIPRLSLALPTTIGGDAE